jgi:threonine dehydrogenase-like Zn-dependent dehydrogenase
MKRTTVVFAAPRQIELRQEGLAVPGQDEVLVETLCSAISAGSEMLLYQGRFPRDLELDSVISALRGPCEYPLAYGYASVGIVREVGPGVDKRWRDQRVFAFQPHTSHFIARPDSLLPLPASLPLEAACFLPNMETAINLVQDGAPLLGERVMVFGQGVVGLLTTSLLAEFPLECLITADCYELRRDISQAEIQKSGIRCFASLDPLAPDFRAQVAAHLGLSREGGKESGMENLGGNTPGIENENRLLDTDMENLEIGQFSGYTKGLFDLIYELSGNPAALNDAIALTRFSGRVVIGSWYGEKRAALDLGGVFHRSRIQLIASQVSTIAPSLSARWDKPRRFALAWQALDRLRPQRWITHRFPVEQAAQAYRLLDERPQDALQVILTYPT